MIKYFITLKRIGLQDSWTTSVLEADFGKRQLEICRYSKEILVVESLFNTFLFAFKRICR